MGLRIVIQNSIVEEIIREAPSRVKNRYCDAIGVKLLRSLCIHPDALSSTVSTECVQLGGADLYRTVDYRDREQVAPYGHPPFEFADNVGWVGVDDLEAQTFQYAVSADDASGKLAMEGRSPILITVCGPNDGFGVV